MENPKRKIHMIGNAHLDPVWLWRWQEGFAEIKATFRSALDRMKEFPEFVFTCSSAAYYQWVEENCPEMFEEIKQRVKEGRWIVVGGWWVQPDCNLPSGESFVRHGLYSQKYFMRKLGVMAKVGYNVDSFGHNGNLPQILNKSGMDAYVFVRPRMNEKKLPSHLFRWESPDGSQVMAFRMPLGYRSGFGKEDVTTWGDSFGIRIEDMGDPVASQLYAEIQLANQQDIDFMSFYGVGNHGGGPTRANINRIRRLQSEWDDVEILFSSPNTYFDEIMRQNLDLPVVADDLQHTSIGCYTAYSEIKANNRKAENRLASAEKLASMAHHLLGFSYPMEKLQKAWEKVLFNQFHDILGGTCIKEAYRDAREVHGEALNAGAEALNGAAQKMSWAIDTMGDEPLELGKEVDTILWEVGTRGVPLVIFNPLSWETSLPVQVNRPVMGITDETGNPVEIQTVKGGQLDIHNSYFTLLMVKIPALGYRVYWIHTNQEYSIHAGVNPLKADEYSLENEWIKLELNPSSGCIQTLFDKKKGVQVLAGEGAVPVVINDPSDTWSNGVSEFRNEVGKFADARVKLLEKGPLRGRLQVTSRYNDSILKQDFIIYPDRPDIEVRVKLDWREVHKLLKLSFPVNVKHPKATYEIPYGFIERPTNGQEEPGQKWLDVSGRSTVNENDVYGLALLNDSKYGFDVKDNDLRMTIVRSPYYADQTSGYMDELCECTDEGIQEFKYVLAPHAGKWQEAGIVRKAYELNTEPITLIETYHKGSLPQKLEGIKIHAQNIIATVFKKAEDGDGYILRCYETDGIETETLIELPILGRQWRTKFGRMEIKTFWIPEDSDLQVLEKNLLEMSF